MNKLKSSDIITNKSLNPDGSFKVEFIYNNKICPVSEITGKKANICSNNQIIIKDFQFLTSTLKTLIRINKEAKGNTSNPLKFDPSNDLHIISANLLLSSVVTYCKCATPSNLRNERDTHSLYILDKLTPTQAETHKMLKTLRDKWVAHTDKNQLESSKTLFVFDPDRNQKPIFIHHASYGASMEIQQLTEFLELVETTLKLFILKQKSDSADLYRTELSETNYKKAQKNAVTFLTYHKPKQTPKQ